MASKTVHGVAGMMDTQPIEAVPKYKNSRTFFGDTTDYRSKQQLSCRICRAPYRIWKCQEFIQKSVSDSSNVAKLFHLCFRCLAEGLKSCPRSRQCGQNGCQESHHRLLHSREGRQSCGIEPKSSVLDTRGSNEFNVSESPSDERVSFGMEGNDSKEQTTLTTQDNIQDISAEFIALRTEPVVLKNGNRSMQVNALLDDASTRSYVNADAAEQLGFQGTTERVTVNVLNETLETIQIDVELESVACNVSLKITAYTANRVTGNMSALD